MIGSVQKIARILNCFTDEEPVLGNLDIATKLDLNPSSVHHLLHTLCQEGMLIKDSQKKYRLGWKLLEWGNRVMYQKEMLSGAFPIVEGLIRRFNGAVHIGMFDQGEVVFVLKASPKESQEIPTYVGSRKPAYCTSSGKILLSSNPPMVKVTVEKGLVQRAPNTITCAAQLQTELQEVKKRGYSVSDNENELGLYGVAAPIRSYSGHTIASLNIVGEPFYMQGRDSKGILEHLLLTANTLSKELGYIEV
ncbi:transcriptional regulator, IclR family [Bacillus sp. OV194]|uniref:IclR family transcriptional regulator n=1 Tax=Fictibacillus sp. B-59209 TaxID=3024873 RepID=UPI0006A7803C|nr:IclR family transcriptional regulator [Fictibacillus sp. B-59209]MED2970658.1 IclR family transcriptional regulator [Fictibacillus sp. B-59209]SFD37503.1 transcriptional regulator, IclR family [Bacillus sp. OV194]